MPNILLPITPTQDAISKYVSHAVTQDIVAHTGMAADAPIYYRSLSGEITQPDSTVGGKDAMRLDSDSAIFVSYKESFVGTSVINTPVREQEELLIFADPKLGIRAKPVYSYTAGMLEFSFRFNTRYAAEQWINDIKVRMGDNREYFTHELSFHYPIPKRMLIILKHIHTLRETQSGYGESYDEYMRAHITPAFGSITNQVGGGRTAVIRQRQIGITGWFEFDEPEQAEEEDASNVWVSSFTYRFEYQKPVEINLVYPLLVHNQLIDQRLFSTKPLYRIDSRNYESGVMRAADRIGPTEERLRRRNTGGVMLPEWDEWLPYHVAPSTASVLTAALVLDPSNPLYLFNLESDVDPYGWHPAVLKFFLESELPYINKYGQSILYMQLYENDKPLDDGVLELTSDGDIYATRPLSLRNTYHLRLSFVLRWTTLSQGAIDRLSKHPDATWEILDSIVPGGLGGGWPWDVYNRYPDGRKPPSGAPSTPWVWVPGQTVGGRGGTSGIPNGWGPNHPSWKDYYFPESYLEEFFKLIESNINGANGAPIRDTAGREIDSVRIMDLTVLFHKRDGE